MRYRSPLRAPSLPRPPCPASRIRCPSVTPAGDRDVQGGAGPVAGQRDGPAPATVGLLDGELDLGLLVGARDRTHGAPAPPGPAEPAAEDAAQQGIEIDVVLAEAEPAGPAPARPGAGSSPR